MEPVHRLGSPMVFSDREDHRSGHWRGQGLPSLRAEGCPGSAQAALAKEFRQTWLSVLEESPTAESHQ